MITQKNPLDLTNLTYLGDGVYAGYDGRDGSLWVYTWNGIAATNQICLEPEVLNALCKYLKLERRKETS